MVITIVMTIIRTMKIGNNSITRQKTNKICNSGTINITKFENNTNSKKR